MLEWIRHVAPDLRIRHLENASGCRFTLRGSVYEIQTSGENARDTIVERAYRAVRDALGRPLREKLRARELERQIVNARWAGQHDRADLLERELIQANEKRPGQPKEARYEPIAPARPPLLGASGATPVR